MKQKIDHVFFKSPQLAYTWNCRLIKSKYTGNDRIALILNSSDDGEPVAVATCNVPEEPLAENEVIIKNYSENEGIMESLMEQGVIGPIKRTIKCNWVTMTVHDCLI